ncbi:hypothetical protein R1flu_015665 [Riccia fluitans]|uniref:Uncharacterized protein n=1 Tax=Riccia fluitans TaxID=41844 RepID=A0ABD1YJL2_9MARC
MTRITTIRAWGCNTVVYRWLADQLPSGIRSVRVQEEGETALGHAALRSHLAPNVPYHNILQTLRSGLTTAAVGRGVQDGLSQRAVKAQRNSSPLGSAHSESICVRGRWRSEYPEGPHLVDLGRSSVWCSVSHSGRGKLASEQILGREARKPRTRGGVPNLRTLTALVLSLYSLLDLAWLVPAARDTGSGVSPISHTLRKAVRLPAANASPAASAIRVQFRVPSCPLDPAAVDGFANALARSLFCVCCPTWPVRAYLAACQLVLSPNTGCLRFRPGNENFRADNY